jgi:sec-independent protein translocase protein TatA
MGIFDWKHWVVILIVVVLVFGTKKLKNLGSDLGETIKGFRKAMNEEDGKPTEQAPQQQAPYQQPQPPQQPLHQPHTVDVQPTRVEEPQRKD